jgi:hypothetical protein
MSSLSAVGDAFEEHVETFVSLVLPVLEEGADSERCKAAVNVVRRISGAIGDKMTTQAANLIPVLIGTASRSSTCSDVVACILSSFVDIVTAVGSACEQYLADMLSLLADAVNKDTTIVSGFNPLVF